jgi:thymidylate synthase
MTTNASANVQSLTFESLDEVQYWVLSTLLDQGSPVTSRGMATVELFPISFALANPRRRCITNPARRWNLPLAIGEFCWHATGSNDLGFIEYYAPRWKEFTDGDSIVGSCYGHHIFGREGGQPSQWDLLVKLLRAEPHSRRAVLQLFKPETGLDANTKDAACTCSIQFMIREERLHAIVYMRSNDAIWGLPYDVFLFTMLQELLALELRIQLGSYFHFVGSMHLYKRHTDLAKRIVSCRNSFVHEMPCMEACHQFESFLNLERQIRIQAPTGPSAETLSPYWKDLLDVLRWYVLRKKDAAHTPEFVALESTYASLLRRVAPIYAEGTSVLMDHPLQVRVQPR